MPPPPADASPRTSIALEVAGQKLRLSANADQGHLESLASLINGRVEALQKGSRTATNATLLALVALDLADEMMALRKKADDAKAERDRARKTAETLVKEAQEAARTVIAEALAEVDRALLEDDMLLARTGVEGVEGDAGP